MFDKEIEKALIVSLKAHKNQLRKGNGKIPFVIHPIRVFGLVYEISLEIEIDDYILCAALLHDVLEDTKYDITGDFDFDEKIIELVKDLTIRKDESKIDAIRRLNNKKYALLIKLADRYDNLRDTIRSRKKISDKVIESTKVLLQLAGRFWKNIKIYDDIEMMIGTL